MRKRYDAASRYVVFHDILVPLAHGVKTEEAFALILDQCGYEPIWSEEHAVTLRLRVRESGEVLPQSFARERINGSIAVLRDFIMARVCAHGIEGWRALPRDQYSLAHGVAVHTVHTVWDWPDRRRTRG